MQTGHTDAVTVDLTDDPRTMERARSVTRRSAVLLTDGALRQHQDLSHSASARGRPGLLCGPSLMPSRASQSIGLRRAAAVTALVALGTLAGCTGGPSLSSGGEQGFVTSDGSVLLVETSDRSAPEGTVAGETVDGDPIALADYTGDVVVIPVWASWCGPCIAEAPVLADAARDLEDDGISFLGINTRDHDEVSSRRFTENYDVPYPSLYDPDGNLLLNFRGTLPLLAIPTLVVIDADGKVAARILDKVSTSTLYGVLEDVTGRDLRDQGQ